MIAPGRRAATALAAALLLSACSGGSSAGTAPAPASPSAAPSPSGTGSTSPSASPAAPVPDVRVARTVASRLSVPWGLAFLSDGSALVAERDTARVVRVAADGTVTPVGTVPGVRPLGEGGLLGLAVAPGSDDTVWAYFTAASDNRVVRMPFDGERLGAPRVILDGIPAGGRHNGGRMVVGPDGLLYVGTGESGRTDLSQRRDSLGGKILRIGLDGSVPADNPFPGSPVWSLGHRNVQGLAFDSTGQLWADEFGQNRFDELNRIVKGGNYGWPVVEGEGGREGFVDPVATWPTDDASPSGLAIVDDVAYLAALRGTRLWQVPLTGPDAFRPRDWFRGRYGRLRTVVATGDGTLWLATSNRDGRGRPEGADDRILELSLG